MNQQIGVIKTMQIASEVISLTPLIVSLINFKLITKQFSSIFLLLVFSFIADVLNYTFVYFFANTNPVYHFYTVIEFSLLSFFYINFFKAKQNVVFYRVILVLFPLLAVYEVYLTGLYTLDVISSSTEAIILIGYSLYFFYDCIKEQYSPKLTDLPAFWFNTAVLFYFSGNLLIFSFNNYLLSKYPVTQLILWNSIHSFFYVMNSILMSIGIWKLRKA